MGLLEEFIYEFISVISKYKGSIIIFILMFVIVYTIAVYAINMLHVFIHEMGHLIFGILVGCPFLYIRISKYVILKKDNQLQLKRLTTKERGGQCLLGPPKENNLVNCILIVIGGSLLNVITSTLAFILIYLIEITYIKAILLLFSLFGFLVGMLNLIPRNQNVINDGRCLYLMLKEKNTYEYYFKQLEITNYLYQGNYKMIPENIFYIGSTLDICNELVGYVLLFQYYYHLDKGEYIHAKKCLKRFEPFEDRIGKALLADIMIERLYMALCLGHDEDVNKLLENDIVRNMLKAYNKDLNIYRIKVACQKRFHSNLDDEMTLTRLLNEQLFKGIRNLNLYLMSEEVGDGFTIKST